MSMGPPKVGMRPRTAGAGFTPKGSAPPKKNGASAAQEDRSGAFQAVQTNLASLSVRMTKNESVRWMACLAAMAGAPLYVALTRADPPLPPSCPLRARPVLSSHRRRSCAASTRSAAAL